jgi:hypothetical protein
MFHAFFLVPTGYPSTYDSAKTLFGYSLEIGYLVYIWGLPAGLNLDISPLIDTSYPAKILLKSTRNTNGFVVY